MIYERPDEEMKGSTRNKLVSLENDSISPMFSLQEGGGFQSPPEQKSRFWHLFVIQMT